MRSRALARAAALLAASTLLLSGCFVFDELDKGREMMEKNSPKKKTAEPAATSPRGEEAQPAGESWWSQARSYAPGSSDADDSGGPDALVRCQLRGSSRFMRRGDCVSQGGRPASG